jgi:hypothetical protein
MWIETIIETEVPSMEAIRAMNNSMYTNLICRLSGAEFVYKVSSGLKDQDGHGISTREILEGRWFVREQK